MDQLQQHIEAIIFSSDHPVKVNEIMEAIEKVFEVPVSEQDEAQIDAILLDIRKKYDDNQFAWQLVKSGGGYQFFSKAEYHASISAFQNTRSKKRLSGAALETLSIIAYKAPVTKGEVEQIRGVNCDYTISKLLEKDLIEIAGKKDTPGNPILYEVSQTFLDYFGINSINDLPKLKDLAPEDDDNQVGERPDIEEDIEDFIPEAPAEDALVEESEKEDEPEPVEPTEQPEDQDDETSEEDQEEPSEEDDSDEESEEDKPAN